ncbi:MAG: M56 family metallopeptidase [Sumerlaeia bacterium]
MPAPLESFLSSWSVWILAASWQLALLGVVVWALCRIFPAMPLRLRYALWLVVLIKAFLPPTLGAPWGFGSWGVEPVRDLAASVLHLHMNPIEAWHAEVHNPAELGIVRQELPAWFSSFKPVAPWVALALCAVWLLGLLGGLAGILAEQGRLAWMLSRARIVESGPLADALVRRAKAVGVRAPRLLLCRETDEPFLCGLFRPAIVLPAGLPGDLSAEALDSVLDHELIHLRRGDLLACWAEALLGCLFWFHPVAWLVQARLDEEREFAVDEAAARLSRPSRYGRALLETALACARQRTGQGVACGFLGWAGAANGPDDLLARRIRRVTELPEREPPASIFGSYATVAVFALVFVPLGPVSEATAAAPPPSVAVSQP